MGFVPASSPKCPRVAPSGSSRSSSARGGRLVSMEAVAVPRRLARIAAGIAAVMCGWLVVLHLRMIVSPAPQEMREGAIIWITRLVLEGRNPYAVSELPASSYAYGIIYRV